MKRFKCMVDWGNWTFGLEFGCIDVDCTVCLGPLLIFYRHAKFH